MSRTKKRPTGAEDEETGGGSGNITLSVEQFTAYLNACLNKNRRLGEQQFAPVPFTEDPNKLLGQKSRQGMCGGDIPHSHPLLSQTQQFSGDHPKLSANPLENPDARERYPELRNENQLRKDLSLGRRKTITLSR